MPVAGALPILQCPLAPAQFSIPALGGTMHSLDSGPG
jgi:hypothetical protein